MVISSCFRSALLPKALQWSRLRQNSSERGHPRDYPQYPSRGAPETDVSAQYFARCSSFEHRPLRSHAFASENDTLPYCKCICIYIEVPELISSDMQLSEVSDSSESCIS